MGMLEIVRNKKGFTNKSETFFVGVEVNEPNPIFCYLSIR